MYRFICLALLVGMSTASAVAAETDAGNQTTPTHGEFAAAIRSAALPCAHVIGVERIAAEVWAVRCNAGIYRVARNSSAQFSVSRPD
jgi:hypothetical protein